MHVRYTYIDRHGVDQVTDIHTTDNGDTETSAERIHAFGYAYELLGRDIQSIEVIESMSTTLPYTPAIMARRITDAKAVHGPLRVVKHVNAVRQAA